MGAGTAGKKTSAGLFPSAQMQKQGKDGFAAWQKRLDEAEVVVVLFSDKYRDKVKTSCARDGPEKAPLMKEAKAIMSRMENLNLYIVDPAEHSGGELCESL